MTDDELPDAHYGQAGGAAQDWRHDDVGPDDDEELTVTPPDVVAMLGFDPLDGGQADEAPVPAPARPFKRSLLQRLKKRLG